MNYIVDYIKLFASIIHDCMETSFKFIIESMNKYSLDNSTMFTIALAFVPAIISITYPLIIQNIGRLNDLYKSTRIIEQFKKEIIHILFIRSLTISVFLTIICFTKLQFIFELTFVSVIFLLVIFFMYMRLFLHYQNGKDLFQLYLKRLKIDENVKNTNKKKEKILEYWYPIIDIFLYSIRNNDRELENDIRDLFIYKTFYFIRLKDQKNEEYVKYPTEIYNGTFDIVTTYLKADEKSYYQMFELFIGSVYFSENYDEEEPQFLHQESYYAIWRSIVATIEFNKLDKIVSFWRNSHQYCNFHLKVPYAKYDDNFKETTESIEKRKKISQNREFFIQFQTALGAYLMHKSQYQALNEIWFYTQSQPPKYVLLPQTVQNIFELFIIFIDFQFNRTDVIINFWFKDLSFDEMNNKKDVKFVICEYLGLLFLRLYITPNFYGNNPLNILPQIPLEQAVKLVWREKLIIFKLIIVKHLKNKRLLEKLSLNVISDDYCKELKVKTPLEYLENFKIRINEDFQVTLETTELSKEKTNLLKSNTVSSIKVAYNDIKRISIDTNISKENRDLISSTMEVIRGTRLLLNREAFIENTSVNHLNADTITGEAIKNEYYNHLATKLVLLPKKVKYEVSNGSIFDAIERLNPPASDYVLLSFGVNISYYKNFKGILIEDAIGDEDYRFKSISIYCFDFGFSPIRNTVFLIKRTSLPMVKHKDWSEIKDIPQIAKDRWAAMELIDDSLKIYCQIDELNTNQVLKEEYLNSGKKEEELINMIEIDIDFLGYIWFKKDVEIIEINEVEMFQEGGSKNKIEDLIPI